MNNLVEKVTKTLADHEIWNGDSSCPSTLTNASLEPPRHATPRNNARIEPERRETELTNASARPTRYEIHVTTPARLKSANAFCTSKTHQSSDTQIRKRINILHLKNTSQLQRASKPKAHFAPREHTTTPARLKLKFENAFYTDM